MGSIAPEIPKRAKAAVYDNPGTVSTKVVMVDVPEPGPGEVLINLYVGRRVKNVQGKRGRN
jgi:propanol-preferring alcohol dehydrogenase